MGLAAEWEDRRLGERHHYALGSKPVHGGQAEVFKATHKPTGTIVAFKRLLHPTDDDAVARMRREVQIGLEIDHPNVMPVLDHDAHYTWLVMPWAEGNLDELRPAVGTDVRQLIEVVGAGLGAVHAHGWVNRDVKPSNILRVNGQWVVSDWGLVRRPAGATTMIRTRTGEAIGTEGFAAPELGDNAHGATAAVDVFSLGQTIGWLRTGRWPQANVPLLPGQDDPWRPIVRAATQRDPRQRLQTVEELLALIADELDRPPVPAIDRAEEFLQECLEGHPAAARDLMVVAADNLPDHSLLVDVVARLPTDMVEAEALSNPERMTEIVTAMRTAMIEGDWGSRNFDDANRPILFLLAASRAAAQNGLWDLLDDSAEALFACDGAWDRWPAQRQIRPWLLTLSNEAGNRVGRALRRHAASARHFEELLQGRGRRGLHPDIAAALRAANSP